MDTWAMKDLFSCKGTTTNTVLEIKISGSCISYSNKKINLVAKAHVEGQFKSSSRKRYKERWYS
jgi:hypothetical protein